MDNYEWKIALEKPIYESFEDVFQKAELSSKEKKILIKYKKYLEFWLLRAKVLYLKSFNTNKPNFVKRLARVLIKLNSNNVTGGKDKLVKNMFSDKSIHQFVEKQNGKLRSKQYSSKIENTYFELEIMSFFLDNQYGIELASDSVKGNKIPEFRIVNNDIRICIEAKKLDVDKILDSIFGDTFEDKILDSTLRDTFINGIDNRLTSNERNDGYKRIYHQLKRNYDNAISKMQDIDENDLYLIFISTNHAISFMGNYCIDYLNNIHEGWNSDRFNRLVGLIIVSTEQTVFIENRNIDSSIINHLKSMNINEFHNYYPK